MNCETEIMNCIACDANIEESDFICLGCTNLICATCTDVYADKCASCKSTVEYTVTSPNDIRHPVYVRLVELEKYQKRCKLGTMSEKQRLAHKKRQDRHYKKEQTAMAKARKLRAKKN